MSSLDAKLQIRSGQKIAIVGPGPDLAIEAERAGAAAADVVLVFAMNQSELTPHLPVLADIASRAEPPGLLIRKPASSALISTATSSASSCLPPVSIRSGRSPSTTHGPPCGSSWPCRKP